MSLPNFGAQVANVAKIGPNTMGAAARVIEVLSDAVNEAGGEVTYTQCVHAPLIDVNRRRTRHRLVCAE